MNEKEPMMRINLGSREHEARRDNTFLYTFLGALACHNTILLVNNEEAEDERTGVCIFEAAHPKEFEQLANYLIQKEYPLNLNQPFVPKFIESAYDKMIKQQLGDIDHIPEGWE